MNIHDAQKKQKGTYARKHNPDILPVGEEVLVENTAQKQRKGGKLDPAWLGPYKISKQIGKGVYELKNLAGKIILNKVNISRLKVYSRRDGKESDNAGSNDEEQIKGKGRMPNSAERKGKKRKMPTGDTELSRKKRKLMPITTKQLDRILKGNCLGDEHISFAQKMLEESFLSLGGLQPTILSQNNGFCPVQSTTDSIQIHYNGSFHWVTSTCISGSVNLYDSKYSGAVSSSLEIQLAQVYKTKIDYGGENSKELFFEVPAVQQQKGGTDCGIFAIAFAYHAGM